MAPQTTVGLLLPYLNAGYDMDVLSGAHALAQQRGVGLIAIWGTPHDILASALARDQIAGWIAVLNIPKPEGIPDLAQVGVPVVVIGALLPDLACPQVLPDNRGGVLAAVRHLLDHGHQRIAFVGDLRVDDVRERYAGYQAALAERRLPLDPSLVFGGGEYYGRGGKGFGGHLAAEQIITGGFPCSAAVAANDNIALELLETLQMSGYRIPADLALVGFDDLREAQASVPPLTTVRQSYSALGHTAAELLLAKLAGQPVPPGPTYVPTELIVRRSCGCASTLADADGAQDVVPERSSAPSALAPQLVRLALHPLPLDPATPPAQVWPGVEVLIQGLNAAIQSTAAPGAEDLARAWQQAFMLTNNLETLHALLKRLERAGAEQLTAAPQVAGAQTRLETFLDLARLELARTHHTYEMAQISIREELVRTTYAVSMALIGQEGGAVARLGWLRQTPLSWGCLGLWSEDAGGQPASLVVGGTYRRDGGATVPIGTRYAAATFPPLDLLPAAAAERQEIVVLLPIQTAAHNWGVLAVCGTIKGRAAQYGDSEARMWATLLGAALEREAVVGSLMNEEDLLRIAYEYRLITENIRDLIFVLDQQGHYLYASPSFQQVLGYRPPALIDAAVFDFIHPDDLPAMQEQWIYNTAPSTTLATFRIRHADGGWRWLEVAGTVVVRHGIPSIVVVGRDITERKRDEEALRQHRDHLEELVEARTVELQAANALLTQEIAERQRAEDELRKYHDQLQAANAELSQYAYVVSHDLQAPLRAIHNYAGFLQDDLTSTLSGDQQAYLDGLGRAVREAQELVKDLLELSQIGHHSASTELIDLGMFLGTLVAALNLPADVEVEVAKDWPIIETEPTLLRQIFQNLILNGVKFNRSTPKRIELGWREVEREQCELSVRDNGIGIESRYQEQIFRVFQRLHTQQEYAGTGIGLAIVQKAVSKLQGTVRVESQPGVGSTFFVTLPRRSFRD